MKVLLTGATGFIGGHLCRRLVAGGNHVVALVRDPKKAASLPGEVERLEGDLSLFDRELDHTVSTSDRIDPAAHARVENRLQAAPHRLAEHGFEGAILCDFEFGLAAADLVLPLLAGKQHGAFAGFLLNGLNMAAADAPHPQ